MSDWALIIKYSISARAHMRAKKGARCKIAPLKHEEIIAQKVNFCDLKALCAPKARAFTIARHHLIHVAYAGIHASS